MDKFGKLFVKASVIYLTLGALFGLHMALADHGYTQLRFIHVHFMLIGFMSMMIFGVGYHILPRFNAKALPYPSLVPVHFWLANAGLVGMGALYVAGAYSETGAPRMLFGLFGLMEALGMFIFSYSIYSVLTEEKRPEPFTVAAAAQASPAPRAEEKPTAPEVKLSPSMKISEVLEKYPHLEEAMAAEGLADVVDPAVRQTAATLVTLGMAAKKAGLEPYPLMARLEGKQLISASDKPKKAPEPTMGKLITRGAMATMDTLVGSLLEAYPETKKVMEAHYGAACFTCPGQNTETIEQTASIHGTSPRKILEEINGIIEEAIK